MCKLIIHLELGLLLKDYLDYTNIYEKSITQTMVVFYSFLPSFIPPCLFIFSIFIFSIISSFHSSFVPSPFSSIHGPFTSSILPLSFSFFFFLRFCFVFFLPSSSFQTNKLPAKLLSSLAHFFRLCMTFHHGSLQI